MFANSRRKIYTTQLFFDPYYKLTYNLNSRLRETQPNAIEPYSNASRPCLKIFLLIVNTPRGNFYLYSNARNLHWNQRFS